MADDEEVKQWSAEEIATRQRIGALLDDLRCPECGQSPVGSNEMVYVWVLQRGYKFDYGAEIVAAYSTEAAAEEARSKIKLEYGVCGEYVDIIKTELNTYTI